MWCFLIAWEFPERCSVFSNQTKISCSMSCYESLAEFYWVMGQMVLIWINNFNPNTLFLFQNLHGLMIVPKDCIFLTALSMHAVFILYEPPLRRGWEPEWELLPPLRPCIWSTLTRKPRQFSEYLLGGYGWVLLAWALVSIYFASE